MPIDDKFLKMLYPDLTIYKMDINTKARKKIRV